MVTEILRHGLIENLPMISYHSMTAPLFFPTPAAPRSLILLLLLSMLTLSACALHTASPLADRAVPSTVRGSQLQGTVVEIATQKTLSFEAFVKTVAQAQVVAV